MVDDIGDGPRPDGDRVDDAAGPVLGDQAQIHGSAFGKTERPLAERLGFDDLAASTQRLVTALKEASAATEEFRAQVDGLIDLAEREYFNDFKSPAAHPKAILVKLLVDFKRIELAQRVADGEFDSGPEEGEAWAESDEAKQIMEQIGKDRFELLAREFAVQFGQSSGYVANRVISRMAVSKRRKPGRRWG